MRSDIIKSEQKKISNLYDQDYYLWVKQTIKLLQYKKFNEIDLDNLIEEMEDMGRSEKKAVTSNLRILLMHLLKYKYQPERRTNSWLFTIREHRKRLKEAFKTSPSLKQYYAEVFSECYQDARELAADETGLSIEMFPETSPFNLVDTIDTNYVPDNL